MKFVLWLSVFIGVLALTGCGLMKKKAQHFMKKFPRVVLINKNGKKFNKVEKIAPGKKIKEVQSTKKK